MSGLSTFLFSALNFAILSALVLWMLGPAANQFAYRRRSRMRRHMLTAILELRRARGRANKSKQRYESLPADISARKESISLNCDRECAEIMEEARNKAENTLKAGERRATEERRRHASLIRERLMRSAFIIAEERIKKTDSPERQEVFLERGLQSLKGMKVVRREVPGSSPKA